MAGPALRCPDDSGPLAEGPDGALACKRCRGQAVDLARFQGRYPGVGAALRPEPDRKSGAYARERRCPRCQGVMAPLRLGPLQAWLDLCAPCRLLWVERLDEAVVVRLRKRLAVERAVAGMPAKEVGQAARGIARELRRDQDDLEALDDQPEAEVLQAILEVLTNGPW